MENNFSQQYNNFLSGEEINCNYNKNNILLNELNNYDFVSVEILYSLLDDYFSLKDDSSLQIVKNKLNNEKFNIKGTLEKYSINNQISENINGEDIFNNENVYEIEIILKKINNNNRNAIEENNNKYFIKLTNINKEFKNYLSFIFRKYYNPILVMTNMEVILELNEIKKYIIKFKNTKQSKIYIEINKIFEQINSKSTKTRINNINEMKSISFQKLNENHIKKFCISNQCFYDVTKFYYFVQNYNYPFFIKL